MNSRMSLVDIHRPVRVVMAFFVSIDQTGVRQQRATPQGARRGYHGAGAHACPKVKSLRRSESDAADTGDESAVAKQVALFSWGAEEHVTDRPSSCASGAAGWIIFGDGLGDQAGR